MQSKPARDAAAKAKMELKKLKPAGGFVLCREWNKYGLS